MLGRTPRHERIPVERRQSAVCNPCKNGVPKMEMEEPRSLPSASVPNRQRTSRCLELCDGPFAVVHLSWCVSFRIHARRPVRN